MYLRTNECIIRIYGIYLRTSNTNFIIYSTASAYSRYIAVLQWKVKVSKRELYGTTMVPYRNCTGYYDHINFFKDCLLTFFKRKNTKTYVQNILYSIFFAVYRTVPYYWYYTKKYKQQRKLPHETTLWYRTIG